MRYGTKQVSNTFLEYLVCNLVIEVILNAQGLRAMLFDQLRHFLKGFAVDVQLTVQMQVFDTRCCDGFSDVRKIQTLPCRLYSTPS